MPTRNRVTYDSQGNVLDITPYTITQEEENEEIANTNLQAQAQAGITALRNFRALSAPTNAQVVAIVKTMALILIQLIRLIAKRFDEVD